MCCASGENIRPSKNLRSNVSHQFLVAPSPYQLTSSPLSFSTDTAHHRVILDRIRSHRQIEKTAGHKVWPTSYTKDESNSELEAAEVCE